MSENSIRRKHKLMVCALLAMLAVLMCMGAACNKKSDDDDSKDETKKNASGANGLIAQYDMTIENKKTLVDKSGNGNDGTIALMTNASSKDNELFLNGTSIKLPDNLLKGEDVVAISLWVKDYTGSVNTGLLYFGTKGTKPTSYWLLNPSNTNGRLKVVYTDTVNEDTPFNTEVGVSPTLSAKGVKGPKVGTEWNHIVIILNDKKMTTYMNNELVANTNLSRPLSDFGKDKDIVGYLGKSPYSDDPLFVGYVRDMKIYNKELTKDEISGLYEEHKDLVENGAVKSDVLIENRADPFITLGSDGYYYFTASYPMKGGSDPEGYDRVILRRAKTIAELATAEEITIWDEKSSSDTFRYIWAPEIHEIKGKWYVFFTGSDKANDVWSIKPHVLACSTSDPYSGTWTNKGVFQKTTDDKFSFENFSLDMTYFECNNKHYVCWAQTSGTSNVYLAEINPDEPWKIITKPMLLTKPEFYWEKVAIAVNEGPAAIIHDGKIYIAYSASATGPEYCVGLMYADVNADLLNIASWKKKETPVLTTEDLIEEYGPGHNSFTVDENGDAVIVYHSRPLKCYEGKCGFAGQNSLYDPCRSVHVRKIVWGEDGFPILNK